MSKLRLLPATLVKMLYVTVSVILCQIYNSKVNEKSPAICRDTHKQTDINTKIAFWF